MTFSAVTLMIVNCHTKDNILFTSGDDYKELLVLKLGFTDYFYNLVAIFNMNLMKKL